MAKRAKSTKSSESEFGCQEPTYRIAPKYDRTELRAVKLLKAGGLLLDPWQSDILDDWMAPNLRRFYIPTCQPRSAPSSRPRYHSATDLTGVHQLSIA